jgi:hypothetical protein
MEKIAIFGVPRSGTSWLGEIFDSHPDVVMRFQPLFSYGHKGRLNEYASRADIDAFFDEILNSCDPFALMRAEMHKSYPTFTKSENPTHIAFKETRYLHIIENMLAQNPAVRIIGIVRNPLAVLASWVQLPKEFNPTWNLAEEWRAAPGKNQNRIEEYFGFEKWKEAALKFLDFSARHPRQFKLVCYRDLIADPLHTVVDLLAFCGLALHPQVEAFIKTSRSVHDAADPYSVFRAKADGAHWRGILPAFIVDDVRRELSSSPLNPFLAERPT